MLKSVLRTLFIDVFNDEFTLTKRQLGILLTLGGIGLLIAAGLAEIVRSAPGGFGTVQQIAVAVSIGCTLLGLTLLPLGDQPA